MYKKTSVFFYTPTEQREARQNISPSRLLMSDYAELINHSAKLHSRVSVFFLFSSHIRRVIFSEPVCALSRHWRLCNSCTALVCSKCRQLENLFTEEWMLCYRIEWLIDSKQCENTFTLDAKHNRVEIIAIILLSFRTDIWATSK